MKKITRFCRLIALVLCMMGAVSALFAQFPRLYTTRQGLTDTRINSVMIDSDDFVWVSSEKGLSRFDGQAFSSYISSPGDPNALQESRVSCVYEDADGHHWVGTNNGLYYLCRHENRFTHYETDSIKTDASVSKIVEDPRQPHRIIMSTHGWGLKVFDTETRTFDVDQSIRLSNLLRRYSVPDIAVDCHRRLWALQLRGLMVINLDNLSRVEAVGVGFNLQDVIVNCMQEDRKNQKLYLGTFEEGLLCCDLRSMQVIRLDFPQLAHANIMALALSPEGRLVVGTESQGLYTIDTETNDCRPIKSENCPVDLQHIKVHSIVFDQQQNMWLGTFQKGLLLIPRQSGLFYCRPIRDSYETRHNLGCVSSFAALPDGTMITGLDGEGLAERLPNGFFSHRTRDNSGLTTDAVLSLCAIPDGRTYIGTWMTGLCLRKPNGEIVRDPHLSRLDHSSVMHMAYDSVAHILYIGTNGDGLWQYNLKEGSCQEVCPNNDMFRWVVLAYVDQRRQLWVGSEGGIYRYNPISGKVSSPMAKAHSLRVYGMTEDPVSGQIWLASDKGLLQYRSATDSLFEVLGGRMEAGEGFMSILRSADGRLWMPSNHGIVSYLPRTDDMQRYRDPEIEEAGSFSPRAAIVWPSGTFGFGADNGMLSFTPSQVLDWRRPLRPLYFTRLWVNNVLTDYDPALSADDNLLDYSLWKATSLRLPSSSNSFAISFAVQEYANPVGIRYQYRLKGYERDWHEVHGHEQIVSYQKLPWGDYTLEVRACQAGFDDANSTVSKELHISIEAPWYARWWAWILWLAAAGLLCYLIVWTIQTRIDHRRHMRLAEQNRQVREAKLRMFTSVSHEIKSPLTLIISPLRKLLDRKTDPATQSVYEMMYRNALRILMLINQQMDIRKLDSGTLALHVKELPLEDFLGNISQYFNNVMQSRQIQFKLEMPTDTADLTIWADPSQLDKVFFNLLSNAFKYVPDQGEVAIRVSLSGSNVVTSIYNSGSHLPESEQADAFANLGLNLARELTELHHGQLTVHDMAEGVSFEVSLPAGKQHYTDEELRPVESQLEVRETEDETEEVNTTNAAQLDEDKRLVEQLSDELREKQRLRERRANLGYDYTQVQMSSADEKLLQRVVDIIRKNLADADFSVETLSEQIGISRVHLNRKLKELIGTSPSSLIKTTRLKQAAFLLVQSNVTVAEIAYTVGFSSPAYFTSNFSQYFGMTPKEFVATYTENPDSPELKKLLE